MPEGGHEGLLHASIFAQRPREAAALQTVLPRSVSLVRAEVARRLLGSSSPRGRSHSRPRLPCCLPCLRRAKTRGPGWCARLPLRPLLNGHAIGSDIDQRRSQLAGIRGGHRRRCLLHISSSPRRTGRTAVAERVRRGIGIGFDVAKRARARARSFRAPGVAIGQVRTLGATGGLVPVRRLRTIRCVRETRAFASALPCVRPNTLPVAARRVRSARQHPSRLTQVRMHAAFTAAAADAGVGRSPRGW
eukprot:167631-Chlamydomonas_euryale.AAC.2